MFLSVTLEVRNKQDAVVAPEEAVVNEGLRHVIFVVGAENKIERRVVRIGQRQDRAVEILEGLQPGETIVVRGVQRVRPGSPVTPKPMGAETSSPTGAGRPASAAQNAPPARRAPEPAAGARAAERRG
jgi:membrane fusion protein (multidrug efflux system)